MNLKKGDKVRILFGWPIWKWNNKKKALDVEDMKPQDVSKEAIIEYTYYDKYYGTDKYGGDDEDNKKKYFIKQIESGRSSGWYIPAQLELID